MGRPLPVVVLPRAEQDIDDAIGRYLDEAGVEVAGRFTEALASAFALLVRNPGIGSLRHATLLALPGMRCWPLRPWPHLIFYLERERRIDVVRVLHGARDVPASLLGPDDAP
ncbi:type II toxin-antitoxin system RelE/ParE family toxin [Azohydromonas sediminis]|uniref:type II toxin-antitoxin system RelE/ParE family toxin n=1 Tax=Azohydromonas sediminis TaxID=2259674 RepID=UPI001F273DA0|nr:type II toxin-antitoxin system RelE/ParE family toxin [Azohydromonas sediminis]